MGGNVAETHRNGPRSDEQGESDLPCLSPWWAGLSCDHLYADCVNRTNAEDTLREWGWWETGTEYGAISQTVEVHGELVCGMCVHRHNRTCEGNR